ncbi:DUF551 domain-containing protein [Escherichia coli]|uniref:DUF551 domain-containing protein n=1 Tax=Escherichia coli TaxID=562 RepID=UPI001593ECA1|nr:DUF551 domain-containing protein [Escherichia coli]NVD46391.1 DUF551 domain-containing protein [Escherichia coli]NVE77834.1 DUF551 domain-containing protein [Escherichia coli]
MTTITKEQLISHARESVSYLEDLKLRASKEGEDCKVVLEMVERELELVRIALASMEAEPVSQTYNLPELIEGMEVSIDVSTCDADLGNRYFGTVTEALELDTAKNGYILLVQDAEPNFDVNGNYPVTPDGWISCSERMPDTKTAVLVAVEFDRKGDWRMKWATYIPGHPDANDGWIIPGASWKPSHWMRLPEPPQEMK